MLAPYLRTHALTDRCELIDARDGDSRHADVGDERWALGAQAPVKRATATTLRPDMQRLQAR